MSKLDEKQLALRNSLNRVSDHSPTSERLESCRDQMIEVVTRAVGPKCASAAAVYGELVDLAVVIEVQRAKVPLSAEVHLFVKQFQADAVRILVDSELNASSSRSTTDDG